MGSPVLWYTGFLAVAVIVTLALGTVGLARRSVSGSRAFVGMVLSGAVYAFGSVFEIRSETAREVWFWLAFEYLGIANLGVFWLVLARQASGALAERNRTILPILFIVPALVIAGVWTNPIHGFFYSDISITTNAGFTVPAFGKGPLYWLNMVYMNLCILGGTLTIARRFFTASGIYRRQAMLMFAGALVPWAGMIVYQAGLSPYGLDLAPIGVAISGCLFSWGLFSFQLFDLAPLYHESVFRDMSDGVLVIDAKKRMVGVNPALASILPQANSGRIGEGAADVLRSYPEILSLLRASEADGQGAKPASNDIEIPFDSGIRHFAVSSSRLGDGKGRRLGTILTFSDVTKRVELAARLEELASVDTLTGILNRRRFFEEAEREMSKARRTGRSLVLGVLDLDFFKTVNDRYGHQCGDAVLAEAASRMRQKLRDTDLLGRYGGEEFVFLLPETEKDTALAIAERIRASIAETRLYAGTGDEQKEIKISASTGLACCAGCGRCTLDSILARADTALYAAKATGRNRVVVAAQPPSDEAHPGACVEED